VSVTLIWTAVTANDLAGYMVYRGENTAENLRPLTREAIQTTTFKDSTVQQGVTYVYAVVALDSAGNPSERSQPQSVTVR
jgi:fibronectin type 3 domain-containing protein